jgi:hypothetical protein
MPAAAKHRGPYRRKFTDNEMEFVKIVSACILRGQKVIQKDCAIDAGYAPKAAAGQASRLMTKPHILRAIAIKTRSRDTVRFVDANFLDTVAVEVIERAMEEGQYGHVLRAIEMLGRDRDRFTPKAEVLTRHMTDREKEKRLGELLERINRDAGEAANDAAPSRPGPSPAVAGVAVESD